MPERTPRARLADRDWLIPPAEQEGLQRYVDTFRERAPLIVATTVIVLLAAIIYVILAPRSYEARADLLITPVATGDAAVEGLGLIRESSDPTRAVETAAQLTTTVEVGRRVQSSLNLDGEVDVLLEQVQSEPVAQSNIVAVVAQDDTPEGAQDLANAFAEEAVNNRTDQLHEQIELVLPGLRTQAQGSGSQELRDQVGRLDQLLRSPDPTVRVEAPAELPSQPVSPRPVLSVAGGLLAGLVLGVAAAFASQVLDPRLRREEQLRRLFRLPILARIPKESKPAADGPLGPRGASPVLSESYRTLRGTVLASAVDGASKSILITGSSASEGKTTTAINLAASLAAAGRKVILIEADLRRPAIGKTLRLRPHRGVVGVLIESVALETALVSADHLTPNLRLLLADYEGGWISELFALPTGPAMLREAKQLADYVIIDSPPLTDVVDALPLARAVDEVLLIAKLGTTRLNKLTQLGELLTENDIRPIGFAVVATPRPARAESNYYAEAREHFASTSGAAAIGVAKPQAPS